jgi:hypothetical protein
MSWPPQWYTILKDFAVPLTALAWGILIWWRDNRRVLSIDQIGSSITSCISEVEGQYTTTFALDEIIITNDSPKANIVIARYDVKPPWADLEIEALPDPKEGSPASERYTVYGSDIDHPREWVINHRRFQYGKLTPGDTIRGTFLARGKASIPKDLWQQRENGVEVEFVVTDTKRNTYRQKVVLFPKLISDLKQRQAE